MENGRIASFIHYAASRLGRFIPRDRVRGTRWIPGFVQSLYILNEHDCRFVEYQWLMILNNHLAENEKEMYEMDN
jgi:hypothetical protein